MLYLSLGANLGDRERTLEMAIRLVGERVGTVRRRSSFHHTAPWGFESQNQFINAAIAVETSLTPRQVLEATKGIERDLGRKGKSEDGKYRDREIDIDILLYDGMTVDEPGLKIPHPLMRERDFVMAPLREIWEEGEG